MDDNDKQFIETLFTKQTEQFQRYISAIAENFDHKLGLIAEGHQMVSDKLDSVEARLDKKLDALAADLAVHRLDTEAHHGMYRVKE